MGHERADHELEIFRHFAAAAGLSTSLQCGEKRKWPEPDVLFQDSDGAQIAFELVELLDQDQRRGIGILVATKTALQKHYENLPNKKKLLFEQKFGNAFLYFRFPLPLTFKRRKAVFVSTLIGYLIFQMVSPVKPSRKPPHLLAYSTVCQSPVTYRGQSLMLNRL